MRLLRPRVRPKGCELLGECRGQLYCSGLLSQRCTPAALISALRRAIHSVVDNLSARVGSLGAISFRLEPFPPIGVMGFGALLGSGSPFTLSLIHI